MTTSIRSVRDPHGADMAVPVEPTRAHVGAYVVQRTRAKPIGPMGIVGSVSSIVRGSVLGPMGDTKRLSASSYWQYFSSFSSVWD